MVPLRAGLPSEDKARMLPRELRRGSIEANFQVGTLELLVVPPAATLGLTGRESFPAGVFQRGMSIILERTYTIY